MNRLTLGVVGHVDHGKTALVRALTGMETDRLEEEKRRGMSIALGFAHAVVGGASVDFIDMPGHERFIRTMASGAGGLQAVLLVVSAVEGVKPQTVEHVEVAGLLGVRRAVVAVTQADLADADAAAATGAAAGALLARAGLDSPPPIATSIVDGRGLEPLRAAIAELAARAEPSPDQGWPYLPIDRAFVMTGHGTVVTGTLRRGRLALGEVLEAAPSGLPVRVRGLQVHGRAVDAASPGQRVAVNLRGVEVAQVARGAALARPRQVIASPWLTVELLNLPDAPELRNGARLSLLVGTGEREARVRLLSGDRLAAGETAFAQLRCAEPVTAPAGERFILRSPSPALTVSGGRVLDPEAVRLRRHDPAVAAALGRLATARGDEIVALSLERAGGRGVAAVRLARLAAMTPERATASAGALGAVRTRAGTVVSGAAFAEVATAVLEALASSPRGCRLAVLKPRVPDAGPEVLDEALARMAAAGRVRVEAGMVRPVSASADRARALGEAEFAAQVAERLRRGGLSPPDPDALGPAREVRRALDRLVREGLAVRTFDRVQKREIVFHRESVEAARRTLAPLLADGPGLLVKEAGAALGVSRKFSVPLLEHLDAVRFTRRVGERRVLAPSSG